MYAISPINQNNFVAAITLLKISNLPTEDIADTTRLFAATDENTVAGTIGIEFYQDKALLRSLAVAEDKRSLGLGKELVDFIEQYAKANGANELVLLTTTAADYFKKRGYEVIERNDVPEEIKKSSEFSSVCPASAIVMSKKLA